MWQGPEGDRLPRNLVLDLIVWETDGTKLIFLFNEFSLLPIIVLTGARGTYEEIPFVATQCGLY